MLDNVLDIFLRRETLTKRCSATLPYYNCFMRAGEACWTGRTSVVLVDSPHRRLHVSTFPPGVWVGF